MSETMTETEAVDALMAAAQEDGYERSDVKAQRAVSEDVAAGEQADTPSPEVSAEEGTTGESDSFLTHLKPDELPDEMIPYYKSMQGDFTRAKQEQAERARQFEALEQYGGVDVAVQGLDWISSLQDPDNAMALHRELTSALKEQGYSVAEAEAEASRQVGQAQAEELEDFDGDENYNALKKELDAMKETLADREEREFQDRIAAQMDRQEAEIRNAHPDYEDDDIEALYALAYSTNANLEEAAGLYEGIESHILGRYIEKKGKPTTPDRGSGVLSSGADADQSPETPKDLFDKGLEERVNRYIAERAAAES